MRNVGTSNVTGYVNYAVAGVKKSFLYPNGLLQSLAHIINPANCLVCYDLPCSITSSVYYVSERSQTYDREFKLLSQKTLLPTHLTNKCEILTL